MHNKVLVFTAYVNCKTQSEIVSTCYTYHGFSCVSATQEEKNNKLHTNKLVSRKIKIINLCSKIADVFSYVGDLPLKQEINVCFTEMRKHNGRNQGINKW